MVACYPGIFPLANGRKRSGLPCLSMEKPLVLPSLDEEARFPEAGEFFRGCGCQSLCVLPLTTRLHRLGALCIGRKRRDAFSEKESSLLSLVSHYAALAIGDRVNFAQSELVRAQLEEERTKLSLILDLNNSVVSNLELRDVLQAISPGIRKAMRLDGVALILPDGEGRELQLYALDFPDANSSLRQDLPASLYGSRLRSRLSHRKAVGWGYRSVAKVRP